MRLLLNIDHGVIEAARAFAAVGRRSIASVTSKLRLTRCTLIPARVEEERGRPVIRVPHGTPQITPDMVRRALHGA